MAPVDFGSLLKQKMGLDAESIGSNTIERAVRDRMAAVGLRDAEDYWQRLTDAPQELQYLIETVVVPETWFFRDRPAFLALVRLVTEEWRPEQPNSTLRILSVPCSTGEEPYSIVMSLLDAGLVPAQVQVDAVDISAPVLAVAKRGVYGSNSFRGGDLRFRERYFHSDGRAHELAQSVRDRVTFHQGNLVSDNLFSSEQPYDAIFCRNLLIYFDRPLQEKVMKKLRGLLTDRGLLFVGAAEAFLASQSGFISINEDMSFGFRKTVKERARPVVEKTRVAQPPAKKASPTQIKALSTKQQVTSPLAPVPVPAQSGLEKAHSLAGAGRLTEAVEVCEEYVRRYGPKSDAFYLLGVLRDAAGDRRGATEYYRKVLYLEPDHVQALMHLALLIESQGDRSAAERLRERARLIDQRRDGGGR